MEERGQANALADVGMCVAMTKLTKLTADTITDAQLRQLWNVGRINTEWLRVATSDLPSRTAKANRRKARERAAEIINRHAEGKSDPPWKSADAPGWGTALEKALGPSRSRGHSRKKSGAQLDREIAAALESKAKGGDLEAALLKHLGFVPDEDFILRAQSEWEGFTLEQLRAAESKMTRALDKQGGRGVDLADRIDSARTALALVDGGFLTKGAGGVLRAVQRKLDLPQT